MFEEQIMSTIQKQQQRAERQEVVPIAEPSQSAVDYFGIRPEEFLQTIGLMKAEVGDSGRKSPGIAQRGGSAGAQPPLRGFTESPFEYFSARGIKERLPRYQASVLREIHRKTPIVSASINLRERQVRQFATYCEDKDVPGFGIFTKDPDYHPTKDDKKVMREIGEWFLETGSRNFPGCDRREDRLIDTMTRLTHETMILDQIAIELRKSRKGELLDFWCLDGGTIRRVYDGGYTGGKDDFDPSSYLVNNDELYTRLQTEAKLKLIPDLHEIAFVQEIQGRLLAGFTRKDLIFECMNKRTDVRFHGYGYSLLEQAMAAVTAFLFALQYNAEQFNTGTIPKVALVFKDAQYSDAQLSDLQDQWISNFRGVQGAWRMPMFNGDVQSIDLLKSPKDMEHRYYLEFTGALIASILGVDTAELGLRFQAAQNVMNENNDARLKYSKDRGLRDQLSFQEGIFNKILRHTKWAEKFVFRFTGLMPQDKTSASSLRSEAVKTYMTIDEIRAREDLAPLPDKMGENILDASWMNQKAQAAQAAAGAAQGGDMGGGDAMAPDEGDGADTGAEGDAGELSDDDIDELMNQMLAKARKPSREAVLLK